MSPIIDIYTVLLNQDLQVLATLPYLCDIIDENLIFDYPTGDVVISKIYSKEELVTMASDFN